MSTSDSLKAGAKIALSVLIVLLIGSIVFRKERMLFSDASFIAFRIINSGSLHLQEQRYGAFITQLFPCIASRLHLPVSAVLLLYSLSFNLFYLTVGWLLYRMKQYSLLIIFAFYLTLYVSDTYFWTNNEIHQGIAWMLLDFGILFFLGKKFKNEPDKFLLISIPLFTLISFIAIYTHPLVMIPLGFLWMFYLISKESFLHKKQSLVFVVIILLICAFKFLQSQQNTYDGSLIHNITHTTLPAVLRTFRSSLAHDFLHGGLRNYWLLWLIFIAGSINLFTQKRYGLLAYTLIGCLCYFMLICLVFYPSKAFYIESEWMPLTILGSAGFIYFLLPKLKPSHVMVLLIFVFAVRVGYIGFSSKKFTGRVHFLEKVHKRMNERDISKLAVTNENDVLDNELLLTWALPYETMLLSSMKGEKPAKTMSCLKAEQIDQYGVRNNTNCIFSTFGPFCNNDMNPYYFRLDTNAHYAIITLNELNNN